MGQMGRILIGLLIAGGVLGSLLSSFAHAQFGVAWHRAPAVLAIAAAGDPRAQLVDEAVAFWNKTLAELGAGFRLGSVTHVVQVLPEEALQSMSSMVVEGPRGGVNIPPVLRDPPGDITLYLAQSEFVSFTGPFDTSGKRVIGIRGLKFPPMTLPNVALNVVTHELGHSIGLGHNSDPTKLMCGRPAPCRPALFRSDAPHIFPLTDDERRQLKALYPPKSSG
jgi:hypothetical protein